MSFSWSIAELGNLVSGDQPVSLRYGDTNPRRAAGTPYTTIIALHGIGVNSNIWLPWLPHLPEDIRLLALNRRGFNGSSDLHQPTDGNFVESYGRYLLDLVAFVKYAVEVLKIPPKDPKTGKGGIVLLGWSKACSYLTSLLAVLSSEEGLAASHGLSMSAFEPYLGAVRSHVVNVMLFEPPGLIFGIPRQEKFGNETESMAVQGRDFVHGMLSALPADKVHLVHVSVDKMEVAAHDMFTWNGKDDEEREAVSKMAFKDVPSFLGLSVIYGTNTIPSCLEGSKWVIERSHSQDNTTYRVIQDGDHFLMVTDPEGFNEAVISCINELVVKTKGGELSV
ncbi:alpha/beta-hydrolase [Dacryopinax primogenitus]|uniref:Alpha/beta-hydrolase n=1 Tax=Dacryopinax primogenitus (strain DJM 731) TaxID=1858805 RepID=M5FP92_DACPD|nr:alpha/beta-hydrolase [Dacryopinax primogenitus]EJT96898.1 alpha/beta-hydrolase [Dacryopinax primogenitus]